MVNPVTGFFNWMFNKEPEKRDMGIPLNADDVKKNKAIIQEVNTLKAQLGRIQAERKVEEELEKSKDKEQEVIKDLKEQVKILNMDKFGKTVSLMKFFNKLIKDNKFRQTLEFTDKDDKEVFGIFGDLLITENGMLLAVDSHGNPLTYGKNLDSVIYKPETLANQLKRKRILLAVDKDFNPSLDIENLEINDVVYDETTQQFAETVELKGKVRELLMDKIKTIIEQSQMIERLELTTKGHLNRIRDLDRGMQILKNQTQVAQSELSQAAGLTMQLNSKIGDYQRQISTLTEMKALNQVLIERLEGVNRSILERLEKGGDKTVYEKALVDLQDLIEFAKNNTPETIIQQIQPETPPKVMALPGQNIGGTGKVQQ